MDPIKLASLSTPVINLYSSIEQDMLASVAEKLSTNKDLLDTDPLKWKLQKLEMVGMLDKENLKTIAKHAKITASELNNVLLNAGLEGLETNEDILNKATKKGAHLKVPVPITQSPQIINIFKAYEQQAKNVLNLTNQSLILQSEKVYVDILNRAAGDVISGNLTGEQSLRKAVRHWAEKGMPVLKDKAGRERGVEGYVRSVLMTTSNNVVNELQDTRLEEWGVKTVEISSHAGNRPGCVPYAGRIFSLKAGHKKYPYLYDKSVGRIGAPDSLFGVNCGHIKYPWVEGVSTQRNFPNDPDENDKVYEESQKQRAIERSIRKAKTQERMFEAMGDEDGVKQAKALVANRQKSMRKFIKETKRTRRSAREQIIVKGPSGIPKVPVPKGTPITKTMPPLSKVKVPAIKPIIEHSNEMQKTLAAREAIKTRAANLIADKSIRKAAAKKVINKPVSSKSLTAIDNKSYPDLNDHKSNPRNYDFANSTQTRDLELQGKQLFNALSNEENYAVSKYVGTSNSWNMNNLLYTGKYERVLNGSIKMTNKIESSIDAIQGLSAIIKKTTLKTDMKLVRNVDENFLSSVMKEFKLKGDVNINEKFAKTMRDNIAGSVYENKSFISASYDPSLNVFKEKNISMELLVEKGTNGFVTRNRVESEIILDKGTNLQFIDFLIDNSSGEKKLKIIVRVLK